MTDFMLYILITSAWIYGFHILFQEGYILESWAKAFIEVGDDRVQERRAWIAKPLFDCPICMSSVWGLIWVFLGLPLCFHDTLPLRLLIPFIMCLCGFNTIISKLTTKERIIVDE